MTPAPRAEGQKRKKEKMVVTHLSWTSYHAIFVEACETDLYDPTEDHRHRSATDFSALDIRKSEYVPHGLVKESDLD